MISIAIVIFFTLIFFALSKEMRFIVFSLAALYPFTFGDISSFPKVLVVEWLTILVFLSLLNELISVKTIHKKLNSISFKGIGIFIFAILILITWIIISYVNNEILTEKLVTGAEKGIKRTYFDIFNNVLIFFTTIIYFAINFEYITIEKFLKSIINVSIIIGIVRIFTFYFDLDTPLLTGNFAYNPGGHINTAGISQRYAGLDIAGMIGLPALFSLYVKTKKINLFYLVILLFFFFLSGGRSAIFGMIVSVVIFSLFFFPRNFIYLTFVLGFFFLLATLFLPDELVSGQMTRLSTFRQTGFMGMDLWRGAAWKLFIENFNNSPIFGKGIGDYTSFIYYSDSVITKFARENQFVGGHGSYLSLLSTLGIGGLFYFIVFVFGGGISAFNKIREYTGIDEDKSAIAVFCFMILVNASVLFIVGYNGLTDVQFMFYIVGLICGIRILENNNDILE